MAKQSKKRIRAKPGGGDAVVSDSVGEATDQPIHFASLEGNVELVRALLRKSPELACVPGNDGWTPLHYAANAGELMCCLVLLDEGARVVARAESTGDTPMHLLVAHSFSDQALFISVLGRMMAERGSITCRNHEGMTPIDTARARGRVSTTQLLSKLSMPAPADPTSENMTTDMSELSVPNLSEPESEEELMLAAPARQLRTPPKSRLSPVKTRRRSSSLSLTTSLSEGGRSRGSSRPSPLASADSERELGDRSEEDRFDNRKVRRCHSTSKSASKSANGKRKHKKRRDQRSPDASARERRGTGSDGTSSSSDHFHSEEGSTNSSNFSSTDTDDMHRLMHRRTQRLAEDELGSRGIPRSSSENAVSWLLSPRWGHSPKVSRLKLSSVAPKPEYRGVQEVIQEVLEGEDPVTESALAHEFLHLFRLSMTLAEVIGQLIVPFRLPDARTEGSMSHRVIEGGIASQELLLRTRTRIVEILVLLVQEYAPDFAYASDAQLELLRFLEGADRAVAAKGTDGGVVTFLDYFPMAEHLELKSIVHAAIEQGQKWVNLTANARRDGAGMPSLVPVPPADIASVDVDVFAQQLTLLAHELYANVSPLLFIHYHHCEADDDQYVDVICSSVRVIYRQYEQLRQWVVTSVVTSPELSVRCDVVEKLIRVAMKCEALSNFYSTEALLQALHSPLVARLTQTWSALSRKTSLQFTEFLATYGRRNNIEEYRRLVDERRPFVPNLDVLKREFTASSQRHAMDLARQGRLMHILHAVSELPYDFVPDEEMQHALYHLAVLPDSIAAHFSNSVQSPETGQSVVVPIERGNLSCSISHGVFKVLSASVDGLIDLLLDSDFVAVTFEFCDAFLLTQSHFISSHELLAKILTKGDVLHSGAVSVLKGKELDAFLKEQTRRRTRVMYILRRWVKLCYAELRHDQKFVNTLTVFCRQAEMASPDETFFFIHSLMMAFGKQPRIRKRMRSVLDDRVQGFSLTESVYTRERMLEENFPKEAAKQMCLIDQKLLHAITARELLRKGDDSPRSLTASASASALPTAGSASSGSSSRLSPRGDMAGAGAGATEDGQVVGWNHLQQWSTRFNLLSQWAATCVVSQNDPSLRVAMLKQVVRLAWECMMLNNFNSSYAIVAGLNSSSVARLKAAWEGLSTNVRSKFERLEHLFDFRANHKNYRMALRSLTPPIIPFLGIYTKDIFAVQENNPDRLESGDINFEKFSMLVRIIRDVLQFQEHSYTWEPNVPLQHFLRDIKGMDEEAMYEASLRREAKSSPVVVHNPLFGKQSELRLRASKTPTDMERRRQSPAPNARPRSQTLEQTVVNGALGDELFQKKVYVTPSVTTQKKESRGLMRKSFGLQRAFSSKRINRELKEEKVTKCTNPLFGAARTPRARKRSDDSRSGSADEVVGEC